MASEEGHKEIVQLLIEKGIGINKTNIYGYNALHLASSSGYRDIFQKLEKALKK